MDTNELRKQVVPPCRKEDTCTYVRVTIDGEVAGHTYLLDIGTIELPGLLHDASGGALTSLGVGKY